MASRTRSVGVGHANRWRIDDEWWREHAVSRMYYTLLLDDDSLLAVYHDLLANTWHEQRG
jgi:hypothetical protein